MRAITPDTWAIDTEAGALLVNDEEMEFLLRLSELHSQNRAMFEAVIELLRDGETLRMIGAAVASAR